MRLALPLLLAVAVLGGCRNSEAEQQPASPPAAQEQEARNQGPAESPALQFVPRLSEAKGWTLEGDPEVIPADGLENYFDTAARIPETYGALDTTVGRYISEEGHWANVRVTRYPDFVKAFGAYSSLLPESAQPVNLGNRGAAFGSQVLFWSGPYVVEIIGGVDPNPRTGQVARAALAQAGPAPNEDPADTTPAGAPTARSPDDGPSFAELARAVAERMPEAEGLPAVFRFLPQRGLIPGSERFLADPPLGQPVLSGAFTAQYTTAEEGRPPITAAIVPTPDKQTAARVLANYRRFFERNGRLLDPVPNLGEENFIGEDRFAGRSVAFRLDRFVVVFNGYDDVLLIRDLAIESAQRILNEIRRQLQALEEAEKPAAARSGQRRPGTPAAAPQRRPQPAPAATPPPAQ